MSEQQVMNGDFVRSTEPFRGELLAHCYRMLGSVDEAEDLVQETYLRAWRAFDRFEGRSSVRRWLYKIATNVCLSALEHAGRRFLPSGLMSPHDDVDRLPAPASSRVKPLQPIPDALLRPDGDDPASILVARESLRLALIAGLQHLPARQRAVLVLRDVLAFPAAEVAQILETSVPAVKSMLQRARAKLEEVAPAADSVEEPTEPQIRMLLDKYIAAFENADPDALQQILREDVALEALAYQTWFDGLKTCMPFLTDHVLGFPGHWKMLPTRANGQPAVVGYHRAGRHYRAFGVAVLDITPTGIARITAFDYPRLAPTFGFPLTLPGAEV
ncbi:sigma-70 family RNA polymerase sigma factor [Nonomuraea sp. NPDC050783]|uniref:sigma-70 family RNA polymerase sigma factor n=1 Tax=Nonomuraea sp. NPDC050783 TaxID=3154634 RepID=UPI0034663EC0